MPVIIALQVSFANRQFECKAIANTGFMTAEPELFLPQSLLETHGIEVKDSKNFTRISKTAAAGQKIHVYRSIEKAKVNAKNREDEQAECWIITSPTQTNTIISDRLLDALKIVILRAGEGKWRFYDEDSSVVRESDNMGG